MTEPIPVETLEQVARERDLYLRLLELGARSDLQPFLQEALALIVEVSGARQGYLALHGEGGTDAEPAWKIAWGCSDEDLNDIREAISRGIIAEALATGRTVSTASALEDPRFRGQRSVRANRIRAVLCAPVGGETPIGVVYLQDRTSPGPFPEEDRRRAEAFARHLAPLADRLIQRARREQETDPTAALRRRLKVEGLVGRSRAMARVLEQVALVAPLEVSVLLTGPSGTGKTELARAIHHNGPRARAPFVELNCAALPENLVESELFGAAPGAHSTASRPVPGKVAAAEGGTLLLDEVGDMPLAAQAKLLQLLQSRRYFRLGSTRQESADVRVIAATNVDLQSAVGERRFREDLLYRLQVLPIRLPALAERTEDIPLLASRFCDEAVRRHRLPPLALGAGVLAAAGAAEWPGNVRQLAHAVEAAAIRAAGEGAAVVGTRHLFPDAATEPGEGAPTFQEATRRFQQALVQQTLDTTGWNVSEAARRLDLARSHLHELIRAFGLRREGASPAAPASRGSRGP